MGSSASLLVVVVLLTACSDDRGRGADVADRAQAPSVFVERCGQCHLPPVRHAHAVDEWPGVVERMRRHMVQRGLPPLGQAETSAILDYLQGRGDS